MASLVLPEYYADLAQTTLSSNYTAASGSIVVTTPSNLSTTRQFHFMVTDQTTGAVKCIGKATALTSSTFTVTMTTDANANSGDYVTITSCAAAMNQIRSDISTYGTFANLPATVPVAGARYKQSDGPYEWISNGSVWQAFWNGYAVTVPPSGGWTTEANSGTVSNFTNGYGYFIPGAYGSASLGMQYATPPSTPYGFIARFQQDASGIIATLAQGGGASFATVAGFAIGWRDSGGKYLVFCFDSYAPSNMTVGIFKFTSYTSYASDSVIASVQAIPLSGLRDLALRIHNDGTNLHFDISMDGGNNWYTYHTETITNYLSAATSVAWGSIVDGTSAAIALYDWTQTT